MGIDTETSVIIARSPADVSAYAADPGNAPRWYANILSVEWRSAPPLCTGSELDFVAQFLGRRMAYTYRVEEYAPGAHLVMRTAQGPFPMETIYTWEATPEGWTRMKLRNKGAPRGFSRLLAPFMAAAVRRANRQDLARLKRLLEG